MQIELNQQEAQGLLQLIDAAVKAVGLQAAESGLYLAKKISDAMKQGAIPVNTDAKE